MSNLIKIGNLLINTDQIINVQLEAKDYLRLYSPTDRKEISCVTIQTTGVNSVGYSDTAGVAPQTFNFYEEAADRLREFFAGNVGFRYFDAGRFEITVISETNISLEEIEAREFPEPQAPATEYLDDLPY